jgi:DNA-binding XRE family transcriptional regulator
MGKNLIWDESGLKIIQLLIILVLVKKVYTFVTKMLSMSVETLRISRGADLKGLRRSKGITQQKMADLSGISLPTIIRMENGKKNWRIESELVFVQILSEMKDTHYLNDEGRWRPLKSKKVKA